MKRSLTDYLDFRLGAHTGKGAWQHWPCPVCLDRLGSESDKHKLGINVSGGFGRCFRCDYSFPSLAVLFRYLNRGVLRMEELGFLRKETNAVPNLVQAVKEQLKPTGKGMVPKPVKPVALPTEYVALRSGLRGGCVKLAWDYLDQRGVTPEHVERFQIGYCDSGRYRNRLVFPVVQGGQVVYFTTRYCGRHDAKTLNPTNEDGCMTKDGCLLNYDNVMGAAKVAVVEGPFDCMAFPVAVALFGKRISPAQVTLIDGLVDHGLHEVVIALDADAGEAADRLHDRLAGRVPVTSTLVLDHGDPWDRRVELTKLLIQRGESSLLSRAQHRLASK